VGLLAVLYGVLLDDLLTACAEKKGWLSADGLVFFSFCSSSPALRSSCHRRLHRVI